MDASHGANVLIRKLDSIARLSGEERQALLDLPMRLTMLGSDQDLVREGDRPTECCLILEGFLCRYKVTAEGKRQILSFHIPGDIPDLQSLHIEVMDHSLCSLVPSQVGYISHQSLRDLCRNFPRLADVFWRDTLIDAAVFREWMVGIGRRMAYARIAHLLCEVMTRLRAVGLTSNHECDLPLTQAEIADALGLSTVHVNRVLQELRANGLIALKGGALTALNWEGLKGAGGFDPTYLHLTNRHAA